MPSISVERHAALSNEYSIVYPILCLSTNNKFIRFSSRKKTFDFIYFVMNKFALFYGVYHFASILYSLRRRYSRLKMFHPLLFIE